MTANSIFISYGTPDAPFARRLNRELMRLGFPTFFFERDAQAGVRLHHLMRQAANEHDFVILICSRASLDRPGVINEIEEVLAREAREGASSILIPIRLDDYVLTQWAPAHPGLAQAIRDRVVADFRGADRNRAKFMAGLARLVAALPNLGSAAVENVGGDVELFLEDVEGRRARHVYRRRLIARNNNVRRLMLRDVTGSGVVRTVSTNIGRLESPIDEGGKQTIWTVLDEPLPMGQEVEHIVELMGLDCYRSARESFAITVSAHYPYLKAAVHFPEGRLARRFELFRVLNAKRTPWPGLRSRARGKTLSFYLDKPALNAIFVVEWDW